MEASIISMLNIWNSFIACIYILGVVHSYDTHKHPIGHCYFSICLGMKSSPFGQFGIHQRPKAGLEVAKEHVIPI